MVERIQRAQCGPPAAASPSSQRRGIWRCCLPPEPVFYTAPRRPGRGRKVRRLRVQAGAQVPPDEGVEHEGPPVRRLLFKADRRVLPRRACQDGIAGRRERGRRRDQGSRGRGRLWDQGSRGRGRLRARQPRGRRAAIRRGRRRQRRRLRALARRRAPRRVLVGVEAVPRKRVVLCLILRQERNVGERLFLPQERDLKAHKAGAVAPLVQAVVQ